MIWAGPVPTGEALPSSNDTLPKPPVFSPTMTARAPSAGALSHQDSCQRMLEFSGILNLLLSTDGPLASALAQMQWALLASAGTLRIPPSGGVPLVLKIIGGNFWMMLRICLSPFHPPVSSGPLSH